MKKTITAALTIMMFGAAPMTVFAWADKAEVENYCAQEAAAKNIAADEVANYVDQCVAANWKAEEEMEAEEAKSE